MAVAIIAGLVFAGVGIYGVVTNRRLWRRGVRTTGSVVDLERRVNPDPKVGVVYFPVLAFRTSDGEQMRAVSRTSGQPPVGKEVPILYDPANPGVAEINTLMGRATWLPALAAAVGLALILYGIVRA
jgi:hypothetical protein